MESQLIKDLERFSDMRKTQDVYRDFLKVSAISISNSLDKENFEPREQEYLQIINQYSKEEQILFPKMFGNLVLEMEKNFVAGRMPDILGSVYEELNMGTKVFQQFFTPEHVSNLMGQLIATNIDARETQRLNEPACGSGRMIYAFAENLRRQDIPYQEKLDVQASDIDIDCVHMTYIQCSLYHIPAIVRHENTLLQEVFRTYKTPAFLLKYGVLEKSLLKNLLEKKAEVTKGKAEKTAEPKQKKQKKEMER